MPSRRSAAAWRPIPPPPPRSLIAPRALITRCQGTAFPSTRQSSGSARSAQPTVRAPRCRPIMKAIWPYVATRPRGTCATVRHTFRNIGSSVIAVGRPVVHVAGTACMLAYAAMADSGRDGSLTDVPGFRVGHATDARGLTGCTVILCGDGAVPGIDVSGMATGLRDPGPCDPCHLVPAVHALFLSGGSAYGLDAAAGVMSFLEERRVGFRRREALVPIVLAAVAAWGDVIEPETGRIVAGLRDSGRGTRRIGMAAALRNGALPTERSPGRHPKTRVTRPHGDPDAVRPRGGSRVPASMTLGVVATNARLGKVEASAVARLAQVAYARCISPVATRFDGDVIFCLSRGDVRADSLVVGMLAIEALQEAILRAAVRARGLPGLPAACDLDAV